MNKSETNIGELLKENNAIFNYIYNSLGYRMGVVVAKKGNKKGYNPIGWALFNEINSIDYSTQIKLKSTPTYQRMTKAFKQSISKIPSLEEKDMELIKDLGFFECYDALSDFLKMNSELYSIVESKYIAYKFSVTHKGTVEAIKLALSRANNNSWNYYSPKGSGHDLRNNIVNLSTFRTCAWLSNEIRNPTKPNSPKLANMLRKSIRKMEYRAWRYFK